MTPMSIWETKRNELVVAFLCIVHPYDTHRLFTISYYTNLYETEGVTEYIARFAKVMIIYR